MPAPLWLRWRRLLHQGGPNRHEWLRGKSAGDIPYESVIEHFGFSMNFKEIDNNDYRENMPDIARDVTMKSGPIFR